MAFLFGGGARATHAPQATALRTASTLAGSRIELSSTQPALQVYKTHSRSVFSKTCLVRAATQCRLHCDNHIGTWLYVSMIRFVYLFATNAKRYYIMKSEKMYGYSPTTPTLQTGRCLTVIPNAHHKHPSFPK